MGFWGLLYQESTVYIICVACNYNNDFLLDFILHETKMAEFEHQQLEIQLEFVH